ncbi:hypothetical protein D3C87_1981580 [compost metagenome]
MVKLAIALPAQLIVFRKRLSDLFVPNVRKRILGKCSPLGLDLDAHVQAGG